MKATVAVDTGFYSWGLLLNLGFRVQGSRFSTYGFRVLGLEFGV